VVAVMADWCQAESRLLLVNPDGSIRATVVSQPDIQVPRFSADGSLIAYVGRGPQEKGMQDQSGITVRKAEGGDNLVSFIAGFFNTAWWSPDGRWMAYSPELLSYQCTDSLGKTQILPFP
jgi:Tol biopolymer transport system component